MRSRKLDMVRETPLPVQEQEGSAVMATAGQSSLFPVALLSTTCAVSERVNNGDLVGGARPAPSGGGQRSMQCSNSPATIAIDRLVDLAGRLVAHILDLIQAISADSWYRC